MLEFKYPYTDTSVLNLDWFLEQFKLLVEEWKSTEEKWAEMQQNFQTLESTVQTFTTFVENYFENLDVQQEINNKLDQMALDGTLSTLLAPLVDDKLPGVVDTKLPAELAAQLPAEVTTQLPGVVADQIDAAVAPGIPTAVTEWLNDNVNPVGSAVTIDSSLTIAGSAADAKVTGDRLNAISEFNEGINIFDVDTLIDGYFVNPSNGQLSSNASHKASDYIPVDDDFIISSKYDLEQSGLRLCFYDPTKTFISGSGYAPGDIHFSVVSGIERYAASVTKALGAAYIRFSTSGYGVHSDMDIMIQYGSTATAYVPYNAKYEIKNDAVINISQFESVIKKSPMPSVRAASFDDQDIVELDQIDFHGRKSYSFFGLLTTMGTLRIGNESVYGGSWLEITPTQVIVKGNTGSDQTYHTYDHGLTFADYIGVSIKVGTATRGSIEISTNGGMFTHDNVVFMGRNGKIQAVSDGCSMTDVILSYSSDCYSAPVWVCGDSYLSNDNPARWTYHVRLWGYDGFALIGFPGEGSADGYDDFIECLKHGTPSIAVWAYGMNDSDPAIINATWLEKAQAFVNKCIELNITPVFATIPNTVARNSVYKNAWIKASGFRYIDFAKAVDAEAANSTWFAGMLSGDNVHPTEQGAIALASQAIADCPELMLTL